MPARVLRVLENCWPSMLVVAVALVTFGRSLSIYFLADDFGHAHYIQEIFNGDLNRLFTCLTGNFMQVDTMAVYRPWFFLTLLTDFALYRGNATGWQVTNLTHYVVCCLFLYLLIRELTSYWGKKRSRAAALFSSLLFTASPLHCESVSWMGGRTDVICLTYYLAALYCVARFLKRRAATSWLLLGLIGFFLAMFTKEMAIGFPVVASVMALLFAGSPGDFDDLPESKAAGDSPRQPVAVGVSAGSAGGRAGHGLDAMREPALQSGFLPPSLGPVAIPAGRRGQIAAALAVAVPAFAATAVYMVIRFMALGTVSGGYKGGLGEGQLESIISRFGDLDTLVRFAFPFNYSIFGGNVAPVQYLGLMYIAVFSLLVTRLLAGAWPRKWLLFLACWLVTAIAPIYQLYGLGFDLEGSRFFFFATAPLAVLLPVLLLSPLKRRSSAGGEARDEIETPFSSRLFAVSCLSLVVLVLGNMRIATRNNTAWLEAGRQSRALVEQLSGCLSGIPEGKRVALLGIPNDYAGAHIVLNGPTLGYMLSPPFTKADLASRLITFMPFSYGSPEKINQIAFRSALADPDVVGFYAWNRETRALVPLSIERSSQMSARKVAEPLDVEGPPGSAGEPVWLPWEPGSGLSIKIAPLDVVPTSYDYLEIEIPREQAQGIRDGVFSLSFAGRSFDTRVSYTEPRGAGLAPDSPATLRVPVSSFWSWYTSGKIESIALRFPRFSKLSPGNMCLIPAERLEPVIEVLDESGDRPGPFGAYRVSHEGDTRLRVRAPSAAESIELLVGKCNFLAESLHGESFGEEIGSRQKAMGAEAVFSLPRESFVGIGYYQIFARALDIDGGQIGELAGPLTLELRY